MLLGLIISIIASHVSYLYNPSMMDYGVCVCVLSGTNLSLILYTRRYFFVNTFAKKKKRKKFLNAFSIFSVTLLFEIIPYTLIIREYSCNTSLVTPPGVKFRR
jgi:uncharacterized membrane-anchored protein